MNWFPFKDRVITTYNQQKARWLAGWVAGRVAGLQFITDDWIAKGRNDSNIRVNGGGPRVQDWCNERQINEVERQPAGHKWWPHVVSTLLRGTHTTNRIKRVPYCWSSRPYTNTTSTNCLSSWFHWKEQFYRDIDGLFLRLPLSSLENHCK